MRSRDRCNNNWRMNKRIKCSSFEARRTINDNELDVEWRNQAILRNNLDKVMDYDYLDDLEDGGHEEVYENGRLIGKKHMRKGKAYVDWRTGEIFAVDTKVAPREMPHQEHAVELDVLVTIPDPQLGLNDLAYQNPTFEFLRPENQEQGRRFALDTCLASQALSNIEITEKCLNYPAVSS
jgi:hypothetical protein